MPHFSWQRVAELLAGHDTSTVFPGPTGSWTTLVRVVLMHGRTGSKSLDWSWISESPLATPAETEEQSVSGLAEALRTSGFPVRNAGLLHALAHWWQRRIGDVPAADVFAGRHVESWQGELRNIPGVSWELADRILLFVGGCGVYPLGRASLRIAARHGWMDLSSEYDDWQAFFRAAAREGPIDLARLSCWNTLVARNYCKSQPRCDECPLKSLLPQRGIVPLPDDEN